MQPNRYSIIIVFFLIFCQFSISSFGQLGIPLNIKKPKEYEERVLRSERSDQKKFTLPRQIVQNTVTHYNYYFNANNKLNEILERAKTSFTDDYSQLLPFYNYTLNATQQDSVLLDSITYKSSSGIALHDLRNDWVDNLYLLWGAAFYLRQEFDSAYLMFQFINYAFAKKEKDGYYKTIGSNQDGNTAFSIATKEKTSLPRKIFSEPPSRNDAFIWQIRNFLAQDQFAEAASLIIILKNDPNFPKRLQNDLHEVQAYWFYKQNMWDSAAVHLVDALDNATNKQEKARWEYLVAQLYELTDNYKESEKYYAKVINHTTDPIMDVYARLFSIRVNKDSTGRNIDRNIAELVKMAKRDKYEQYRDIIYYMAAQMELEKNNPDGALSLLLKSTQYASNNLTQRNKAFLQLAELYLAKQQYRQAYNFYDSLRLDDPLLKDVDALTSKKEMLGNLATNLEIIARQDSLQRIALLPENERRDFVKKLVRQLRKQQGLKDEGTGTATSPFATTNVPTLFPSVEPKGEWYFYNTASRARGQTDFKTKWGNRPDVDNWRRVAAITPGLQNRTTLNPQGNNSSNTINQQSNAPVEITFENLYDNLPLTPEQLKNSNDSIQNALYKLGKLYIQEAENCLSGTETLEQLRSRFPEFDKMDEVLFNLYYCYNKNGETDKAAAIKKLMSEKNANSNFTTIVTTGKNPQSSINTEATSAYEKIYELFIEGNFEQAVTQKKIADSIYGKNYWTPQLLYIESVYYIRQRQDSTAKNVLNNIISQFPGTPLANKATTLLNVLGRRNQIEEELRNMVVTRPHEDTTARMPVNKIITNNQNAKDTANKTQPVITKKNPFVTDTLAKQPPKNINSPYVFKADAEYYVVIMLNKVDPVFSNEAKNAFFRYNRETFYNKLMTVDLVELDADNRLLLISPFKNVQEALDYVDRTRPKTASEIIPWLKGGKYNFSVITDSNLQLLKTNKDIDNYKTFLNQNLPGKF
jgi:tetratricopeptide (TPR) repeat protein